jgi:hypothetical protein
VRKEKVVHISACVDRFLNKSSFNPDGYALRVFFDGFVGPKISKYAQIIKCSKDTVVILVKSPVIKNEIMLMRRKIIKALNSFLGDEKIKNLKIIQE